jgi:hypothetical protein
MGFAHLQLLDCQLVEAGNCAQDRHPSEVGGRFGDGYGRRTRALGRQDRAAATLKSIRNSGIYAIYIDSHYAAFPPTGQALGLSERRRKHVVETSCFANVAVFMWRDRNDTAVQPTGGSRLPSRAPKNAIHKDGTSADFALQQP